jgi:uncharacterized protein YjlB
VSRDELAARLRAEGHDAGSWSNGPGDVYAAHAHAFDKVLVCAAGGIVFGLPGRGQRVALGVGDRLDLPAGTEHDAVVGPEGVTCLEAHLAAGSLSGGTRHRPAGTW